MGKNAPALFSTTGEKVVSKLRDIKAKFGYSFSLLKTNTEPYATEEDQDFLSILEVLCSSTADLESHISPNFAGLPERNTCGCSKPEIQQTIPVPAGKGDPFPQGVQQ